MASVTLSNGTSISPLFKYVIVEPRDSFRHGDLELPAAYDDDVAGDQGDYIRAYNRLCLGLVIAVGPGEWRTDEDGRQWRDTPDVEVGELVVYSRADGVRLGIAGVADSSIVLLRDAAIAFGVPDGCRQVLGGVESGVDANGR